MKPAAPNRDSVTTINRDGSRRFLRPADAPGRFLLARRLLALALISLYVALPWIDIAGHPAVLLDVVNRRFHFFSVTFAAQDLWLAFFLITGTGFTLFVITSIFGRLWCGWACPHTVFLEHVYRRVERWIEGPAHAQRELDDAPWTAEKVCKRAAKHAAFILISALLAHIFLAYFVPIPRLYSWMLHSPLEHWGAFVFVFVATALLYFNFSWFREQLCLIICPYGRLQSALIDDNTLVIGYHAKRGEPRGKPHDAGVGHCVDCTRCVQVCPVGIDIRQGLQIECIGCAACVDACDEVMDKLHRPRGLVRYDSLNGLEGRGTRFLRPRLALYAFLLLAGAAVMTYSIRQVKPIFAGITRMQGSPYYVTNDTVRNQFLVRLINKQDTPANFSVTVESAQPGLTRHGLEDTIPLDPLGEIVVPLVVQVPRTAFVGTVPFTVVVRAEPGSVDVRRQAQLVGPDPRLLREEEEERRAAGK